MPVKKIDLYPFREITDGKDLAYLMLLRSYIADSDGGGLLEAYEFSPDGKSFIGKISETAKWDDGTILTSREAALGIAKGLKYRTIGKRVKVIGTENMEGSDWFRRNYSGISLKDSRTFELRFESSVENLTGALREALSNGSRHNRLWPIKLGEKKGTFGFHSEVLMKYRYSPLTQGVLMRVGAYRVELVNGERCVNADFSIYPEPLSSDLSAYDVKRSSVPQSISVQMNTKSLSLVQRKAFIGWIRDVFSRASKNFGIDSVQSFFLPGESGFSSEAQWEVGGDREIAKCWRRGSSGRSLLAS